MRERLLALLQWWRGIETPGVERPTCPSCGGAALSLLTVQFRGVTADAENYLYKCLTTGCNTLVVTPRALHQEKARTAT